MHQIIVVPTGSKANAALFFSTKETAEIAHKNIHDAQNGLLPVPVLKVVDDYGCTMTINVDNICYVMLMDGDKQAHLARAMGGGNMPPAKNIPEA